MPVSTSVYADACACKGVVIANDIFRVHPNEQRQPFEATIGAVACSGF